MKTINREDITKRILALSDEQFELLVTLFQQAEADSSDSQTSHQAS